MKMVCLISPNFVSISILLICKLLSAVNFQLKVYDHNIWTTDSLYFIVNDLAEILRINVATRPQPDEHPPCLDCFLSTFISHRRDPIQYRKRHAQTIAKF